MEEVRPLRLGLCEQFAVRLVCYGVLPLEVRKEFRKLASRRFHVLVADINQKRPGSPVAIEEWLQSRVALLRCCEGDLGVVAVASERAFECRGVRVFFVPELRVQISHLSHLFERLFNVLPLSVAECIEFGGSRLRAAIPGSRSRL